MSILYLIRHAQASFGSANYDRLSETGRRQASVLAGHLADRGVAFDAVYSGAQRRHAETLAAFTSRLSDAGLTTPPVTVSGVFNEYDSEAILRALIPVMIGEDPGFEAAVSGMMRDKRAFQVVFERVMRRWVSSAHAVDGLETWKTYSDRVAGGLQDLMAREGNGKHVAVFTSGGAISVCVQRALGLSDAISLDLAWQIMNASITRLKYSGRRLMLFGFNDAAHLEIKNEENLLTYR